MTAIALPRQPHSAWLERLRSIQLGLGARGAMGLGLGRSGVSAAGNGLLNNLVAYWKLDEAGGANDALDAHSNGLTLTQVSNPGADTGKVYSTARTFDGSADWFSRAADSSLQTGDIDFTIACWVFLTKTNTEHVVYSRWDVSSAREYFISWVQSTNQFRFIVSATGSSPYSNVSASTFGAISSATWYFIVAQHDAANNLIGISVNDTATDTSAHTTGVYTGSSKTTIGTFNISGSGFGPASWGGRIGPVAFWKSAAGGGGVLTAAQRTALYNGGAGLPYSQFTT